MKTLCYGKGLWVGKDELGIKTCLQKSLLKVCRMSRMLWWIEQTELRTESVIYEIDDISLNEEQKVNKNFVRSISDRYLIKKF